MAESERELLARIDERLKAQGDKIDGIDQKCERAFESLKEHRKRIEALERWRAYLAGIALAAGAVFGWLSRIWNGR